MTVGCVACKLIEQLHLSASRLRRFGSLSSVREWFMCTYRCGRGTAPDCDGKVIVAHEYLWGRPRRHPVVTIKLASEVVKHVLLTQ